MMIIIPPSPSLTEVYCRGSQTSLAQGGPEGIGLKMYGLKYRDYAMGPIFGGSKDTNVWIFVIGFPVTVYWLGWSYDDHCYNPLLKRLFLRRGLSDHDWISIISTFNTELQQDNVRHGNERWFLLFFF